MTAKVNLALCLFIESRVSQPF